MREMAARWRTAAGRARSSPDTIALLVIIAAVVLANLPALVGFVDPNALDFRSGLTQALTPGLISGKPTVDPSNGFDSQAIGHLAALDWLHLHLPWWNPYEGTGMPLAGETQAAALFPPTLLTYFSNGQLYEHVLFELIAGICTYRLLRRIGLIRAAALAGGVAYALNGKFAWFSDAGVNPVAFLPMLLLGLERAYAATLERRGGGWRLMALAVALAIYAGFPEVAFINGLMAIPWLLWRCGCLRGRDIGRLLIKAVLGGVAGLLLAAPMLVAMLDYVGHADLVTHVGSSLGSRHLPFSQLPQLVLPYVYGPVNGAPRSTVWIMVGGYLTAALVLLALVGLTAPGRRGLKVAMLAWGLLVFSHIYGVPGVGQVLDAIPGVSHIQFYRYATAALELPVIVLAALGIDGVTHGPAPRRRLLAGGLVGLATVGVAAIAARPEIESLRQIVGHGHTYFLVSLIWGLATAATVAVIAAVPSSQLRASLLTLVVALDAVALFAVPQFAAPRQATVDRAPVAYLQRHLGLQRFYTLGPIQPNYGSYFAIAELGVDDFPPKSYAGYVHHRLDPAAPFVGFRTPLAPTAEQELMLHLVSYGLAGVRYVLAPAGERLPTRRHGLRLVDRTPTTWIYEITHAAPFMTAAGCRVSAASFDSAQVTCPRPTRLIRRETSLPGWTARVDGRVVPIGRVKGLFQSLTVPAGTHRITFSFVPVEMDWGLIGLLAGCALMLTPALRRVTMPTRVARATRVPAAAR
jgi:hypothetical protein